VATRKKRTSSQMREELYRLKTTVYNLNEKYQEQLIFERLTEQQKTELNVMLQGYQLKYGPVQYHSWLRAVMRSMREHFTDIGTVMIYPLLMRKDSNQAKKKFLEVMAVQMGLDVSITKNTKSK
jgi:hypothetical protein